MVRGPNPKVTVSLLNDQKLKPAGKICRPMGMPQLTGGLMRSHSQPMGVLTCPGGTIDRDQRRVTARGREHRDRLFETAQHCGSVAGGAWADMTATLKPSMSMEALPAGGRTQGTKHFRSRSMSSSGYDPTKHGWYHPAGQAEEARLADPSQPGSWSWTMGKARDHIGYGKDGQVDSRDVQVTGVSGDAPAWFLGTRSLPGPFGTRKHPVRRCPFVVIEGDRVRVQAKTYERGDGLSAMEVLHDRSTPPTPAAREAKTRGAPGAAPYDNMEHQARRCNLEMGGCTTKRRTMPPSNHVTTETFVPPRMGRIGRGGV